MKWQHGLMAVGLAVGVWLIFFSDKTPDADVAEAIVHPPLAKNSGTASAPAMEKGDKPEPSIVTSVASSKNAGRKERVIPILALVPRQTLISVGHVGMDGKKLAGTSQIFGPQSWVPPPPPPPDPKLFPPPPPSAPPLRFTFVGEKLEDGVWEVYLAEGDKSYAVHNQSVINGTYRVDAITPNAVVMTYLPLNQVQRLNLKGIQ